MSEIIPPSDPEKGPSQPLPQVSNQSSVPGKKFYTGLGILLFIGSAVVTFVIPPACLLGLIVAIGSLFFKGYRFIFVGYILTLGILLLGMIIYCSNHPFEDR
jgi:hypothetical protein